jgi:GNAT superfamily N-acetyltransferase
MTPPEIEIRIATSADVPAIVGLYYALSLEDAGQRDPSVNLDWAEEHGAEHFTQLVAGEASVCFVAQSDQAAIGYLAGYTYGPSDFRLSKVAELQSMFVQARWRGQQVGAQLVEAFVAWARSQGATRMNVTAYATNQRAIAFYQHVGFAPHQLTFERTLI